MVFRVWSLGVSMEDFHKWCALAAMCEPPYRDSRLDTGVNSSQKSENKNQGKLNISLKALAPLIYISSIQKV